MYINRDNGIAVLGLGHVGLPTALCLAELGWSVVGVDSDLGKAEAIAGGEAPFYEPGVDALLTRHLDTGKFAVEADLATALRQATVLFVCVGTPQHDDGSADLSMLDSVSRDIAGNLNGYKLIVEKSTTPVQTAQQIKQSILRYSGARASRDSPMEGAADFDVAVNPEFLREGTAVHDFFNPDRIVLGVEGRRAAGILLEVYQTAAGADGDHGRVCGDRDRHQYRRNHKARLQCLPVNEDLLRQHGCRPLRGHGR